MNGRLIRWDEYLLRFDFEIEHVEGIQNKVADCLSRLYENDTPEDLYDAHDYVSADIRLDPEMEDMTRLRTAELLQEDPVLLARHPIEDRVIEAQELHSHAEKMANEGHDVSTISLEESIASGPELRVRSEGDTSFEDDLRTTYSQDPFFPKILSQVSAYSQFELVDGLLYVTVVGGRRCLCVPRVIRPGHKQKLTGQVLDAAHSTIGHYGDLRTSEYVRRWFWWPKMGPEIEKFCASCGACKMAKSFTQKPVGLLHSLPVPDRPWESIGMDFVGPFPPCLGYDYLLVVICRLTNIVALSPMRVTDTSLDVAWIFVRDIVRLHGVPQSIVSDQDSKFTSKFWRELHRLTGTKLLMSTSFHPQTDGASERAIRNVSQILRTVVDPTQRDWVYHIPMVEFAINSSISASTGYAPFELNYGYVPRLAKAIKETASNLNGVREFVNAALANITIAHDAIIEARVRSTYQSNKHRGEEMPYEEGALVYLSTKNLNLPKGRARKLAPKFIGPFKILRSHPDTSNYTLALSEDLVRRGNHPTFHSSLLRAHEPNDELIFPSREANRFYDFGMPDNQEWLVDEIVTPLDELKGSEVPC
jgi:hypothetical protein